MVRWRRDSCSDACAGCLPCACWAIPGGRSFERSWLVRRDGVAVCDLGKFEAPAIYAMEAAGGIQYCGQERSSRGASRTAPPDLPQCELRSANYTALRIWLIIPLCVFASDSLLRYSATWPWWIAAVSAFIGLSTAVFFVRENVDLALTVVFNLAWLLIYAVIIVAYRQSGAVNDVGHLVALAWVGAVGNALLLAAIIARYSGSVRDSSLALRMLFISYMVVGMALTAVALRASAKSFSSS